ncbi:SOS response-associated peptidase [Marivita sp. S6314]|uniref:SOS response-associated peptidase n=1 Tax=Marivita sp. S6314 TaxID=2926406 RepID=UPI001FF4DF8D|nr:SOS response-associated peptidase [Marivita sp. S6314]MCK0149790.1 SOS response-associated peptidase [Marivita sp. S6314]
MPGRLFLTRPVEELAQKIGVAAPPNEPPRRNIQPGQTVLCLTPSGFDHMRWGMIPSGRKNARGRPVMDTIVNARSETLFDKSAFSNMQRAIVPADGWYEWTGEARRKTAWEIRSKTDDLLWFAAIYDTWHGPNDVTLSQLATVTGPPNQDLRDIHDRMGVLLEIDDIPKWMTGDETAARSVFRPWPDGRLTVIQAKDVDWSQP